MSYDIKIFMQYNSTSQILQKTKEDSDLTNKIINLFDSFLHPQNGEDPPEHLVGAFAHLPSDKAAPFLNKMEQKQFKYPEFFWINLICHSALADNRELLNRGIQTYNGLFKEKGFTEVQTAVLNKNTQKALQLLEEGKEFKGLPKTGPIEAASRYGTVGIVKKLLESGNCRNNDVLEGLYEAIEEGHAETVELLWSYIKDKKIPNNFISPLKVAAYYGHKDVVEFLTKAGESLDDYEAYEDCIGTPLHVAAVRGYKDICEVLIAHGAKIDSTGWVETPLMCASESEYLDVVRLLIAKGANLSAVNDEGQTALHAALKEGSNESALELIQAGSPLVPYKGKSPLFLALAKGDRKVIDALIEKGEDVHKKNKEGDTPLHKAAAHGNKEGILALVGKGAKVDEKNTEGDTPLQVATKKGHKEELLCLLR